MFGAESEELLVELVREQEFIYNVQHESHLNATKLANAWDSISKFCCVILNGRFWGFRLD